MSDIKPLRITKSLIQAMNERVIPDLKESFEKGENDARNCEYFYYLEHKGKLYCVNVYNEVVESRNRAGIMQSIPIYKSPKATVCTCREDDGCAYWDDMSRRIDLDLDAWRFVQ